MQQRRIFLARCQLAIIYVDDFWGSQLIFAVQGDRITNTTRTSTPAFSSTTKRTCLGNVVMFMLGNIVSTG